MQQQLLMLAVILISSFLVGAVPTGWVLGKLQGKDISDLGSKNIGATNTARVLGPVAGAITLLLDMGKGAFVALAFPRLALPGEQFTGDLAPLLGLLAVLGHCYSPFLHWNGGKGVATSFGVLLSVATVPALSGMLVFVAFFLFSKVVAIASLGGILSSALITSYLSIHFGLTTSWVALMLTLIVFVRHRSNLERLLSGSEEPFASIRSE